MSAMHDIAKEAAPEQRQRPRRTVLAIGVATLAAIGLVAACGASSPAASPPASPSSAATSLSPSARASAESAAVDCTLAGGTWDGASCSPTPLPSDTPSATDTSSATDTPSATDTSSATDTPSATDTSSGVDLVTAVRHGLVAVQAAGDGIQSMQLSLSSKTSDSIDVTVTPGMIFKAAAADVQSMVATSATDVVLNPGDSGVPLTVDVACTNMHLSAPTSSNTFSVRSSQSRTLRLLVSLADFQQSSPQVQQFAVWTITDNPGRYGFTELCTDSANCSGPTDDEIDQIRQLFKEAGITTSNYAALQ
jgi:hypothetical protein